MSYLLDANAQSQACGHFFMDWLPTDGDHIKLNGAFHISANILCFIVVLVAEAELGVIYHNCQTGIAFWQTLGGMRHHNLNPLYILMMPLQWVL